MSGIFKSYDIRGTYPDELDEPLADEIGIAIGNFLENGMVVVGHDMRDVAEPISAALVEGLLSAGQDVLDIGLCSTPMNYNAIGHFDATGGVMVTASHNPPPYIGFKISRVQAKPVSYESGIETIEESVRNGSLPTTEAGSYEEINYLDEYVETLLGFSDTVEPISVAVDTGNGMGGLTVPELFDRLPIDYEGLYLELDGSFPNHIPNPLEPENLEDLESFMKTGGYDLGIAFDGDADRAVFLDETGRPISADLVTALLSERILRDNPGASIIYDLRSSRIVPETIERHDGNPVRYRVGHAYIKEKMRSMDAVFGGELSGHYYYRKNYYTDCGLIAALDMIELLSDHEKPLSELIEPLRKYHQSGEINFEVADQEKAMQELEQAYPDGEIDHMDGVTVQFDDWWFNVRPSNTEPLLRLNLEATTKDQMESRVEDVKEIIENSGQ
jgi:phosphomannomutase